MHGVAAIALSALMAIGTCAIGLIPSYAAIGFLPRFC